MEFAPFSEEMKANKNFHIINFGEIKEVKKQRRQKAKTRHRIRKISQSLRVVMTHLKIDCLARQLSSSTFTLQLNHVAEKFSKYVNQEIIMLK